MAHCKIDVTGSSNTIIAKELRRLADLHEAPKPQARWPMYAAFILGCIFVASLDYGDVWICVGECGLSPTQPAKGE